MRRPRGGAVAAVAAIGLLLTGCEGTGLPADDAPSAGSDGATAQEGRAVSPLDNPDGTRPGLAAITSAADRARARALIGKVATKGRGPKTGYDRDEFGYAWMDNAPGGIPFSHNGCDSRIISMLRRVTDACAQVMQGVVNCAY